MRKSCAFERLILTHISQNLIFTDGVKTRECGEYYNSLLFLFDFILDFKNLNEKNKHEEKNIAEHRFFFGNLLSDVICGFNCDTIEEAKMHTAELLIKLLARPFFSFDYSFRTQMQSFLIILAECYLDVHSSRKSILFDADWNMSPIDWNTKSSIIENTIHEDNKNKGFLRENHRIEKTMEIARKLMTLHSQDAVKLSMFLKDVLFEALADMRSTYLLRKRVIHRVQGFVNNYLKIIPAHDETKGEKCNCWNCTYCKFTGYECAYLLDKEQCRNRTATNCFWAGYLAHLQRTIENSSDELRALWFEHFLLTGNELTIATKTNNQIDVNINSIKESTDMFLLNVMLGFDAINKVFETDSDTHYLSNYQLSLDWLNQIVEKETFIAWHEMLISQKDSDESKISDRYKNFLERLREAIATLNKEEKGCFNIAVLTVAEKSQAVGIEDFQIVHSEFGKNAPLDTKQAKYIIKDRVMMAYNAKIADSNEVGILSEDGYFMSLAEEMLDDEIYLKQQTDIKFDSDHHVMHNHRKPYVIIYFDNPNHEQLPIDDLGRKLAPLSKVFLYVSMHVDKQQRRNTLPWIVLRNILAYRNRIMRFLSEDFNGDIMEKHAISTQQDNILTHDRAASHAATTDERGVLQVFGLGDVSELSELTYPVKLPTKDVIDNGDRFADSYKSAELWLLLQNYVNGQIARLFNRCFNPKNEVMEIREGIPAIYVNSVNQDDNNIFKHKLESFKDLNLSSDNRFSFIKKIATIKWDKNLSDAKMRYSADSVDRNLDKYYNAEYIRCILLDIILTSIKFATTDDALLSRVDTLMQYADKQRSDSSARCFVFCYRSANELVMLNNVDPCMMDGRGHEVVNEEIFRRTHDPLDYGDGHMSLFTIRRIILGIWGDDKPEKIDVKFSYIETTLIQKNDELKTKEFWPLLRDEMPNYKHWFETRLPIFKEDNDNGNE